MVFLVAKTALGSLTPIRRTKLCRLRRRSMGPSDKQASGLLKNARQPGAELFFKWLKLLILSNLLKSIEQLDFRLPARRA
jgi:hypothetical protein